MKIVETETVDDLIEQREVKAPVQPRQMVEVVNSNNDKFWDKRELAVMSSLYKGSDGLFFHETSKVVNIKHGNIYTVIGSTCDGLSTIYERGGIVYERNNAEFAEKFEVIDDALCARFIELIDERVVLFHRVSNKTFAQTESGLRIPVKFNIGTEDCGYTPVDGVWRIVK